MAGMEATSATTPIITKRLQTGATVPTIDCFPCVIVKLRFIGSLLIPRGTLSPGATSYAGELLPGSGAAEENLSLLYPYLAPTGIGIEASHRGCCFSGGLSQVLLQKHAILVDDEGHHPGIAVLGRIGDEGESTDHPAIDHVVLRTAVRVTALAVEHMEVVA